MDCKINADMRKFQPTLLVIAMINRTLYYPKMNYKLYRMQIEIKKKKLFYF